MSYETQEQMVKKLKAEMKKKKIKLIDISRSTGLHRNTVRNALNCHSNTTIKTMVAIRECVYKAK